MSKILVKAAGVTTFQDVGGGEKPSFSSMARNAFARPGQGVTGSQRLRGLAGVAGKTAAAAITAQSTAEQMQAGNLGAGLQAGVAYRGTDPTATFDDKVSQKINQNAPALGRKNPVAIQAPAPTPNNPAPDYSNMPPMHRPVKGRPIPQNYPPAPAPVAPAPAPVAPAPAPVAPAPAPVAPAPQAPAPVTALDTKAMIGVVGQQPAPTVPPQQIAQQPVAQQPVPQQPVPQQPVGVSQVPLPGQTLTQEQMKAAGRGPPGSPNFTERPASMVNPLPQGSGPPGMQGGTNFNSNPYGWQPQQQPPQQPQQQPPPFSLDHSFATLNPQMPTENAMSLLGGKLPEKPQGYTSAAGVNNPNDPNFVPTRNTNEIVRDGMPNEFKPLENWDDVRASLFTGAIYDKLGPDMVYKMTPHQLGILSAFMYLKLS